MGNGGSSPCAPQARTGIPSHVPSRAAWGLPPSLGTVQPVGLLAASVTLPPVLHRLLLPSLSSAPASLLLLIPCPVALGEQEAARSSFSVPPYTTKRTVRKRRRWQVWGSSRYSRPAPEGRAWKRRQGHCLSQPVLRFSRASVQNPCSAGLQKRTGLIITLSPKAN